LEPGEGSDSLQTPQLSETDSPNSVKGERSFAIGSGNTIDQAHFISGAIGKGLKSNNSSELVIGEYNDDTLDGYAPYFEVGTGTSSLNRKTKFYVTDKFV